MYEYTCSLNDSKQYMNIDNRVKLEDGETVKRERMEAQTPTVFITIIV